jgi:hypothetical protein
MRTPFYDVNQLVLLVLTVLVLEQKMVFQVELVQLAA